MVLEALFSRTDLDGDGQIDLNEWLLYGARREKAVGQAKESVRQKEKAEAEATEKEAQRRRRTSYLQTVDGGGAPPLLLEYAGMLEGEEEAGSASP